MTSAFDKQPTNPAFQYNGNGGPLPQKPASSLGSARYFTNFAVSTTNIHR